MHKCYTRILQLNIYMYAHVLHLKTHPLNTWGQTVADMHITVLIKQIHTYLQTHSKQSG